MSTSKPGWNAEDYAKNSSAQFKWATELIAKLDLRGCESVLDIGCGDGKITAEIARIVNQGKVLGIDLSQEMIDLASKTYGEGAHPNLSFARMDAASIAIPEQFDVAFSNAALHWVADHEAVLRGTRACLRPGGKILFQMGGRGNAEEISHAFGEVAQRAEWRGYFGGFAPVYRFRGPEDYEAWLPKHGFRPVRLELIPRDMQHAGIEGLVGWLRTTWFPYTNRVPMELRDRLLHEVVATHTATHPVDALGNTHVRMVRLEVEAIAV